VFGIGSLNGFKVYDEEGLIMRSRKRRARQEDSNVWIAYTDLLTALLTFFVILSFISLFRLRTLEESLIKPEDKKNGEVTSKRLPGDAYFESGKSELKPKAREELIKLGQEFRADLQPDEVIVIQGHTDDVPYDSGGRTNWELSGDRAAVVCRVFQGSEVNIAGRQLIIMGYGEFSPLPDALLKPEDSATAIDDKRARNRRIEIIKLKGADVLSTKNP
jgi:flagellar motor protein MotB